ncbi:HAMP domain-containing sensor histidine kinase [Mycolicibacterium holsaticum]|uniref:HAMP domain-containing sensor histidine kinase n=1 Tax=Mycolicibacterium holsaticum TaxID=152142 RepID=UPI001C7DC360|nr:ATP-binding protein [Mycolicibacterium holsaticum]MDA4109090.1 integral membrane sensor signal transduction histidine kinase [Mycolicibacterium holsaticum DSM 44478 = JCM 12374]QZA11501.1 HAMP domain-containing protein [Mycolicibacterium holsaticum DSM 44478 = JCM 12374]UNC11010.1 sensor histidine kinase [Mycolicibacterium holsaticum DSM 44478 = JCM 12374]
MSAFSQLKQADGTLVDFDRTAEPPIKRPSRWSLANWPVRWKVLAIVLVPLVVAATFGGLRIYSSATQASELRLAAERVDMLPAVDNYMASLEAAMLARSTGGDTQAALTAFDANRQQLQTQLSGTDVAPDVGDGVRTLIDGGQALMDKVTSNSIGLRDTIQAYALLLLPAEDAINGSVRVDDERIRAETAGLSRAVGARGQMTMQRLTITRGGELPEPELRTSMIALAGTEPSTLFGMSQVLGVGSPDAQKLQAEFVKRMALLTDPAVPLVNNPELLASVNATEDIARQVTENTTASVTSAVGERAAAARSTLVRDAVVVAVVILLALVVVIVVARSLVRPLRRLRDSALKVAHEDLTREIEHVRAGGEAPPVDPIPVHTSEEVGQVAHAVDELHEQALLLASEQSRLQLQVGDMFETLSRRSRSLVDQQLALIDRLERNEEDPERLDSLFRLDHLAARMRRNGANLLVLAGARVPREQADPVPVSAVINAAASEVEDYTRVVTATVPDSEVVGAVAGDIVHLLAELLDNALRYSPPVSQVRVSAVHTANGGLVIEVSDIGLGMTESDLRVANTRLQSGGEVTPYTARHMGLFVVGRLAAQHGLVVRLRSTVAGEPNSGMTAGVYIPTELLAQTEETDQFSSQEYASPADAHAGIATALALDEDHYADERDPRSEPAYNGRLGGHLDGHLDVPETLLPQRHPGASGISGTPSAPAQPEPEPEPVRVAEPSATAGSDDAIYQKMLSEWLVDPTELASSTDLNWESVWDHGWSAAAAAEEAPVQHHTEEGLPVREPGARLVPGGADEPVAQTEQPDGGVQVASAAELDTAGPAASPTARHRDPEAVRASISSHFGGVHAGRSHARETRGTENE